MDPVLTASATFAMKTKVALLAPNASAAWKSCFHQRPTTSQTVRYVDVLFLPQMNVGATRSVAHGWWYYSIVSPRGTTCMLRAGCTPG